MKRPPLEDDPTRGLTIVLILFLMGVAFTAYGVAMLLGWAPR